MSLIKFNTARPAGDPFNAIFNDFFEGEFYPRRPNGARNSSLPAANIKEVENAFHIDLAAPGMKKDDFKIKLDENLLTIRTEKKDTNEENVERYTKREFNYTSFVRSFRLPKDVNHEEIAASYENGILRLSIPKLAEEKMNKREIAVK